MLGEIINFLIVITIIIVIIYTIIKTRKEVKDLHFKMDVALRLIDRIPKEERDNLLPNQKLKDDEELKR